MPWPRGRRHSPQKVMCTGCGAAIMRCSHTREARCERCKVEGRKRRQNARWVKLHREARRYRIVLHVLGWEDEAFAEMLSEMKHSPMMFRRRPEGRNACIDVAYERKARAG